MAETDREHWNRRYSEAPADWRPSAWLLQHETLIRSHPPNARALDVACGRGQNSLYLARLGYQVDAWDISDVALDALRAQLAGVTERLEIAPRQVDLATASLPPATYDLILDINFLQRSLFLHMAQALRPDGLLLIRTLMRQAQGGDDRNPAYLLEPGELLTAFADLQILQSAEDSVEGWAALVARRPAKPAYSGGGMRR